MKTALKIAAGLGAVSALSGLASTANAQATASATATGSATIIQPISVSPAKNLAFGTIVKPSDANTSTVTIDTSGNRSVTGGNAAVLTTSTASAASFVVTGEGGSAVSVSVPTSFTMAGPGTGNNLTVNTSSTTTAGNLSGSIGSPGSFTVAVGGSFTLTSATVSGAYSGNLVVTAQYN